MGMDMMSNEDKALPLRTIKAPNGNPYLSIISDDRIVRIQIHRYDGTFEHPVYFTVDKRCLPELTTILKEIYEASSDRNESVEQTNA